MTKRKALVKYEITLRNNVEVRSKNVCIKMPAGLLEAIDELVATEMFQNRSDVVREAVRRMVLEYKLKKNYVTVGLR